MNENQAFRSGYYNPVTKKQKEVVYWMGRVKEGQEVTLQVAEVQAYRWAKVQEAHQELTYKEDKDIMEEVLQRLGR